MKLSRSSVNKFTGSRCVWGTNHMRKPRSERAGFRLQLSTLEECLFRLFLHQNFCSTLDVSSTTPFSVPSYLLHLSSLPSSTLGTPLNFRLLPQCTYKPLLHCRTQPLMTRPWFVPPNSRLNSSAWWVKPWLTVRTTHCPALVGLAPTLPPDRSGYLWPLLPKDAWASEIDSHLTPVTLSLDHKFLEGWDHIQWHLSALPGMPSTEGTWKFMKALRTLGIFTENVKCAIVENSNWPNSPVEYTGTEPSFVFPHKTIPWSELYKKSYFTDTQRIRFVGESYGEAWVYHLQFQGLRAPEKSLSPSPQAHRPGNWGPQR